MQGMNLVVLAGTLGADPEMKYTQGGHAKLVMRLATSEKYKNRSTGELLESTQWHNVVAWGDHAESVGKYLEKGSNVLVEGKIEYRSWDTEEGVKKYATDIKASRIRLLPSNKGGYGGGKGRPDTGGATDDDIPF